VLIKASKGNVVTTKIDGGSHYFTSGSGELERARDGDQRATFIRDPKDCIKQVRPRAREKGISGSYFNKKELKVRVRRGRRLRAASTFGLQSQREHMIET